MLGLDGWLPWRGDWHSDRLRGLRPSCRQDRLGGGTRQNFPGGDYFQWQATYTQGAIRYVGFTPAGAFSPNQFQGQNLGYGFWSDAVFSNATGEVQLTTAWGINAAYDHLWAPNFRTSIYGSYWRIEYGNSAN